MSCNTACLWLSAQLTRVTCRARFVRIGWRAGGFADRLGSRPPPWSPLRKLSTSVRQVGQGFVVPGAASSGLLIHAAVGSWGGVGACRQTALGGRRRRRRAPWSAGRGPARPGRRGHQRGVQADAGTAVLVVVPAEEPGAEGVGVLEAAEPVGDSGRCLRVLSWLSEYRLSLLVCGRLWLLVTPRSAPLSVTMDPAPVRSARSRRRQRWGSPYEVAEEVLRRAGPT